MSKVEVPYVMQGVLLNPLKIIVIGSIDQMLESIMEKLNRIGIGIARISTQANSRHLLGLLDRGISFHIVLLDLDMSGIDGMELLYQLSTRNFSGSVIIHSLDKSPFSA